MWKVYLIVDTGLKFSLKMVHGEYNKENLTESPFDDHSLNTVTKWHEKIFFQRYIA